MEYRLSLMLAATAILEEANIPYPQGKKCEEWSRLVCTYAMHRFGTPEMNRTMTFTIELIREYRLLPNGHRLHCLKPHWYLAAAIQRVKEIDTVEKTEEAVFRCAQIARSVLPLQRERMDEVLDVKEVDADEPLPLMPKFGELESLMERLYCEDSELAHRYE